MVVPRRSDRLHQDRRWVLLYRGDAPGWLGRAAVDPGFPGRRTDLGAEWADADVLSPGALGGRPGRVVAALFDRSDRRQPARGRHSGRCFRPGLVAAASLICRWIHPGEFITDRHDHST